MLILQMNILSYATSTCSPTFPSPLQLGGTRGAGRIEPVHGSPASLSPYVVPKRSVPDGAVDSALARCFEQSPSLPPRLTLHVR